MKRRELLVAAALALAACAGQPAPDLQGDLPSAGHLDLAVPLRMADDGTTLAPPVTADGPFDRIGLMFDAPEGTRVEVRVARESGPYGQWQPLIVTWREKSAQVAHADVGADHRRWQLRFPGARPEELQVLLAEAFVYAPEQRSPEQRSPELPERPRMGERAPVDASVYVSRAAWGSRQHLCTTVDSAKVGMVVHHTASPFPDTVEMPVRVRQTQAYHMDSRGYCDMGYHFMVGQDGKVYQGRIESFRGAHAAGANEGRMGICLIGNFMTALPPAQQTDAGAKILHATATAYGITLDRSRVKGHRESGTTATACPGDAFFPKLGDMVAQAAAMMPPPPTTGTVRGVAYWNSDATPSSTLATDPTRALAGVTITARPSGDTATTGPDGRFSMTLSAGSHTLSAALDGYEPGPEVTVTLAGGQSLETSLLLVKRPTPDLSPPRIALTSPSTNVATADVAVMVTGTAEDEVALDRVELLGAAAPLSNGRFAVKVDLAMGENRIEAKAFDKAGNFAGAAIVVTRIAPASGVKGTVSDATTGEPLSGAVIRVADGETELFTDEEGRYAQELFPGQWRLSFAAAGHRTATATVEVTSGFANLDVALEQGEEPPDAGDGEGGSAGDSGSSGCDCSSGPAASAAPALLALALLGRRRRSC